MRFRLRGYTVTSPHDTETRESRFDANRLLMLIFAHLALTFTLSRVWTIFGNGLDILLSFLVGIAVISLWDVSYIRRIFWMGVYTGYLLWHVVIANFQLAWLILQPQPRLNPGIIAVPLRVESGLEITTLASSITLTPGTLSVDLIKDESGTPVLYVHTLRMEDPEQFRNRIRDGFERLILNVTRD